MNKTIISILICLVCMPCMVVAETSKELEKAIEKTQEFLGKESTSPVKVVHCSQREESTKSVRGRQVLINKA